MDPSYSDKKRNMRIYDRICLVAGGDYGIPKHCSYGGQIIERRIIEDTSQTEAKIGKRYFLCNVFENYDSHTRKPWDIAVEEEVSSLTKEFDEESKKIRSMAYQEFQIKQNACGAETPC